MNNQKDIKKTSLNSYGQSNVLDVKALNIKHVYEFANKKTEKLVTALYMVTDCMDTDDALKGKLRQLGVELLSDTYKLSTLSPLDKHVHISASLSHIDELLSFVEIAYTIGFISEMNTAILKKEFMILTGELDSHLKKDKHFTFTLDEDMFALPENRARQDLTLFEKDRSIGQNGKRTTFNNLSFMNNKSSMSLNSVSKSNGHVFSADNKKERIAKILTLIKDMPIGQEGASIRDIANSFKDCSEKTIQRELNALVLKGQIKKTGLKRWSRYELITD